MKTLPLLIILVVTGCAQVSGTRKPDGTLTISTHRLFWTSEGIHFTLKSPDGFSTTLSVQKSNPNAEAIAATAEGVARGLATAAKP